ncbi:hypothetical protein Tco_1115516, partial [Tanacetum coccineum]
NELKIAQTNLDNHPHNQDIKEKEVKALKDYNEAANDAESKLLEDQFVNNLKNFPGASNLTNEFLNFKGVFGTKLNNKEAIEMNEEVTDSEIKNALFDIGDNKAPGPDRYTSTFFKKAQRILHYCGISSLIPNMDKSTVFFGNVKNEESNKILVVFPFAVGNLPVKYLGVMQEVN